jgi:DNA-binding NtrC family response regulator
MTAAPNPILLVDDEADFVEMLSLRLQEIGETVVTAAGGGESLELLKKMEVDVIILDVKMPGMDGIETLEKIKRSHPLAEVIMLTGHGTIESAIEGMKLGAYDLLLKPADFGELVDKLKKARRRKQEQMERIRTAETSMP